VSPTDEKELAAICERVFRSYKVFGMVPSTLHRIELDMEKRRLAALLRSSERLVRQ